jgi:hypothetical protein
MLGVLALIIIRAVADQNLKRPCYKKRRSDDGIIQALEYLLVLLKCLDRE